MSSTPSTASTTDQREPAPVIWEDQTYNGVTDQVMNIPLGGFGRRWLMLVGVALTLTGLLVTTICYVLVVDVGAFGINIPVAWGFLIVDFVWWIGIGHAGTLISAILLLLKQGWRTSINRIAEAMTLFAVMIAGLGPLMHLGRHRMFFYLLPYPNTLDLWPQWRSPLVWDIFAVLTYFTVSLLFWYQGLIPDLATMRDTAKKTWTRRWAGIFAMGWRGSAKHWQRYHMTYILIGGLATPLVVSVHSIVSLDFAVAIVPGWHLSMFPPYFVAGAIFSGFTMVITIAVPIRYVFGLQNLITERHLNNMAKLTLVTGMVVVYSYIMEHFMAWYSGSQFEIQSIVHSALGAYAPAYWVTMFCNVVMTQTLWFRKVRVTPWLLFFVAQFINVGMWVERFWIIVPRLNRDYPTSMWHIFNPTVWDWTFLVGTLGFFMLLMLLLFRIVPMIPAFEVRQMLHSLGKPFKKDPPPSENHEEAEGRESPPSLPDHALYALAAEFPEPEPLTEAAKRTREAGYRRFDAFTPYPVDPLPEAMGLRETKMPAIVLLGGLFGAGAAYLMQYYAATISYPWNIGGRPFHSWPSFVPITFELAVLFGSLFGFFGMLALNRLPQPYHSMFNHPSFDRASRDRFFLTIEREDELFERQGTREFLEGLGAIRIREVEK